MVVVNIIAFVLLAIGGLNWGLIALFDFNLVSYICGEERNVASTIIYLLVCAATIWLIISLFIGGGNIAFRW